MMVKFRNPVKTLKVNGMTRSAGIWTKACPNDADWNRGISFPFLKGNFPEREWNPEIAGQSLRKPLERRYDEMKCDGKNPRNSEMRWPRWNGLRRKEVQGNGPRLARISPKSFLNSRKKWKNRACREVAIKMKWKAKPRENSETEGKFRNRVKTLKVNGMSGSAGKWNKTCWNYP